MVPSSQDANLVVFFRPQLTLAWCVAPGEQLVLLDGTSFKSKVDSDFTGFYDRMYDARGRFLGLQVLPLLAEQYLSKVLSRFHYVRPTSGVQFRVFLTGSVDENPQIVDDQGFGGRIYEAIDGEFAMSFDVSWMSQPDVEAIQVAPADWIGVDKQSALMNNDRLPP